MQSLQIAFLEVDFHHEKYYSCLVKDKLIQSFVYRDV